MIVRLYFFTAAQMAQVSNAISIALAGQFVQDRPMQAIKGYILIFVIQIFLFQQNHCFIIHNLKHYRYRYSAERLNSELNDGGCFEM